MSLRRFVLPAIGIVLLVVGVSAQQSGASDPIRELLVEVRGLRAAMERSAIVGARVQLLVARIQLQEQRIAELSRRATTLRSELRDTDQELLGIGPMVQRIQEVGDRLPAEQRAEMEQQATMMKGQVAVLEKRRIDLTQEEGFVAQQLAEEQGRWSAINDQLDALERSLITGKQ